MRKQRLEFIILDELKRDFSLNPIQYKYDNKNLYISSENLIEMLHLDFERLLLNPTHSDITLNCNDGGLVKAHKDILIARCGFFEKMFSHQNIEFTSS